MRKQIIKHEGEYSYPTSDVDMGDVETILHCINGVGLIAGLKRCYEVMDEVILRAMDAREEEASDIIKHGDEEYVHVDEITYPFSKSDIDAALDSKASE